jgi:hypothetical protein
MKKSFPLPAMISIPSPMASYQPRGLNANKVADPVRTIRISQMSWDAMAEAAEQLGMTTAEFVRWTSYSAANEVLRHYKEYLKTIKDARPVKEPPLTLQTKSKTTLL